MASFESQVRTVTLRPTARAWWLLVTGVALAVLGDLIAVPPLRWVGAAMAALPVTVFLSRVVVRPRLDIERSVFPTRVASGERLRVVAEVRNRSIFGVEPGAYVDILTGAERNHVGGVLPAIASRLHPREGRRRRRIAYGVERMRRGIAQVGPLLLENADGLGLTRRVVRVGEPLEVEVWPHIHDVAQLDVPALRSGDEVEVSLGRSGEADDVITREYRRGDPLRRVHWRATARAGELRVRQEEHHSEAVATVILDTAPRTSPDNEVPFDLTVSVVASLVMRLRELGFDTDVAVTHPSPDIEGETIDGLQTAASESVEPLMRRLMLVDTAPAQTMTTVGALADRIAAGAKGPLLYTGRAENADALDLAALGNPAVAVLVLRPGEGTDRVRAFTRAGWRVATMNAAATNPWRTVRSFGEAGRP